MSGPNVCLRTCLLRTCRFHVSVHGICYALTCIGQVELSQRDVFDLLAARAASVTLPTVQMPPACRGGNGGESVHTVHVSRKLGIRVEVPRGALPSKDMPNEDGEGSASTAGLAARTLPASGVRHLSQRPGGGVCCLFEQTCCPFPLTAAVEVRYSADVATGAADRDLGSTGRDLDSMAGTRGAVELPARPLTLHMPHACGGDAGATDSVVVLGALSATWHARQYPGMHGHAQLAHHARVGAAHGAAEWERIDNLEAYSQDGNACERRVTLNGREMSIRIPYPGTFCAFAARSPDSLTAVRFHVFTPATLTRETVSSLRVHLCPELPQVIDEVRPAQSPMEHRTRLQHVHHTCMRMGTGMQLYWYAREGSPEASLGVNRSLWDPIPMGKLTPSVSPSVFTGEPCRNLGVGRVEGCGMLADHPSRPRRSLSRLLPSRGD